MKITAIILSVLLVIAVIGFGVSVVVTGEGIDLESEVKNSFDGLNIESVGLLISNEGYGESFITSFSEEFSNIEIGVISAETIISFSDDNAVHIDYEGKNSNVKLTAEVSGNKLIVLEKSRISFPFFNFNVKTKNSVLKIAIPEKEYKDVKLNTVSGSAVTDGLISEKLTLNTTSGSINLSAFADKIVLSTVSGDIKLENCTSNKADSITSSSTSGSTAIMGYRPERFALSAVSGEITMSGASGKGDINLTSGSARIEYDEWNDKLNISAVSGSVEVTLPEGSGIDLDFSRISGEVKYDLDGEEGKISKEGDYNNIGGENIQKADVNLTSGKVSFNN